MLTFQKEKEKFNFICLCAGFVLCQLSLVIALAWAPTEETLAEKFCLKYSSLRNLDFMLSLPGFLHIVSSLWMDTLWTV